MKLTIGLGFLFLFMQTNELFAQLVGEQHLEVETRSYSSTEGYLPFWLWANQKGMIDEQGKFHQLSLLKYVGAISDTSHQLKLSYGVSVVSDVSAGLRTTPTSATSAGSATGLQLNEVFFSIAYKKVLLKIGEQAVETQLNGLSTTNGDFNYSNNSRPYLSLLLGTNGFIHLFKDFSFSAVYEEALIRDQYEYIKNPNLHHKNLFLRWGNPEKLRITAGMDDYAWWGGTSPDPEYGKLPTGFGYYLRVIMCRPGGPTANWTERENAAGNHLGQWKLTIEKEIDNHSFSFYLMHPIEDRSGIKWQNYQDNLYGMFWENKQKRTLISSALVEFYFTRNQNVHPTNSITYPSGQWAINYFNHYIYTSGFTYKGNVIGAPLFYPVVYDSAGKIIGIANTRFYAFHGGIDGSILPRDHYKFLVTYSLNSGIWNSYPNKLKRISSLFEYSYSWNTSIGINCGLAHDFTSQGGVSKQVLGGYVGVNWKILP